MTKDPGSGLEKYPVSASGQFLGSGLTVFFKLSLQKGFNQISVSPEDCYTAIVNIFWMFQFLRFPFDLWNTWEHHQTFDGPGAGRSSILCCLN